MSRSAKSPLTWLRNSPPAQAQPHDHALSPCVPEPPHTPQKAQDPSPQSRPAPAPLHRPHSPRGPPWLAHKPTHTLQFASEMTPAGTKTRCRDASPRKDKPPAKSPHASQSSARKDCKAPHRPPPQPRRRTPGSTAPKPGTWDKNDNSDPAAPQKVSKAWPATHEKAAAKSEKTAHSKSSRQRAAHGFRMKTMAVNGDQLVAEVLQLPICLLLAAMAEQIPGYLLAWQESPIRSRTLPAAPSSRSGPRSAPASFAALSPAQGREQPQSPTGDPSTHPAATS